MSCVAVEVKKPLGAIVYTAPDTAHAAATTKVTRGNSLKSVFGFWKRRLTGAAPYPPQSSARSGALGSMMIRKASARETPRHGGGLQCACARLCVVVVARWLLVMIHTDYAVVKNGCRQAPVKYLGLPLPAFEKIYIYINTTTWPHLTSPSTAQRASLSKQTCKCGQQHDDAEQTPLSRRRPHRRRRARRGARRVAGARGHRTVGAGGLFSPGSNASSRLHEQKKRREP